MFMSQSQMVEKVKAAHQAWGVIGNREMRPAGWEGPRLLLEPPLVEHFSILPLTTWSLRQRGWDVRAAMDRFGLHKLMTWRIDTFPPRASGTLLAVDGRTGRRSLGPRPGFVPQGRTW
jgi:hypothetical protein